MPNESQKRNRPRALTLTLPDERKPVLVLGKEKFSLRNFSESGIGLWTNAPLPFAVEPGKRLRGEIAVRGVHHPVELELAHKSPGGVGLKLVTKSEALTAVLKDLLRPTTHAAELTERDPSRREDSATGDLRLWFTGPGDAELVVWYRASDRSLTGVQLCWLGMWAYRGVFQDTHTGVLQNSSFQPRGRRLTAADGLRPHEQADDAILHQAAQFLSSVPPPLPGYLLWQFFETGEQVFLPKDLTASSEVA